MYKSDAQRRYFHTDTARRKGITPEVVEEYDEASKGMHLPERKERPKESLSQFREKKQVKRWPR
jgi:hypothetical protein